MDIVSVGIKEGYLCAQLSNLTVGNQNRGRSDRQLRRLKYLNNVIEQDHRFIKKKVRSSQCFKRFHTAERTLEGIESMNMMRKGQFKRLAGDDAQGRAKFVLSLFQFAAQVNKLEALSHLKIIFAT